MTPEEQEQLLSELALSRELIKTFVNYIRFRNQAIPAAELETMCQINGLLEKLKEQGRIY